MKTFAVTVLVDGPDERTVQTEIVEYLNKCLVLENIEINDIEELQG